VYLVLNVAFGTVGHLGGEPLPARWSDIPVLRYLAGSTFHARHHQALATNFGFYTVIWDSLFGTLHPYCWRQFGRLRDWVREPMGANAAGQNAAEPPASAGGVA